MAKPLVEILVPIFNFAGAGILCIDALRSKTIAKERSGAKELIEALRSLVVDEEGKSFDSELAIEEWLAARTLRYGWVGFILLAIGFLLDLIAKITATS